MSLLKDLCGCWPRKKQKIDQEDEEEYIKERPKTIDLPKGAKSIHERMNLLNDSQENWKKSTEKPEVDRNKHVSTKQGKLSIKSKRQSTEDSKPPKSRFPSISLRKKGEETKTIADRMDELNRSGRWEKKKTPEKPKSPEIVEPMETPRQSLTVPSDRDTSRNSYNYYVNDKKENYSYKPELDCPEFSKFAEAKTMLEITQLFAKLMENIGLEVEKPTYSSVFSVLRDKLKHRIPNKYDELLSLLEVKSRGKEYGRNVVAEGKKVIIIGAGPCGLRIAMEMALLGAETVVLEKRNTMNRNNVLKLWPWVMEDLKSIGAKQIYQKLGHGSINHISIWMLQIILLKLALILGVQVRSEESFKSLVEPNETRGWVVISERKEANGEVTVEKECDVVICATGRGIPEGLVGFERNNLEAKQAIAITANWKVFDSEEEKGVEEIPGLSWQNNMDFFNSLEKECGVNLENLVHFKDMTHYFVMTAKKESLVKKGVIISDTNDRDTLLNNSNIDKTALNKYAMDVASFSTNFFSSRLPCTLNDIVDASIFDFTHLYSSKNACKVMERKGHRLLLGLIGDSLMEPFWPEGLGISRGFLSVLDTSWMVRRFFVEPDTNVLEQIEEREKLYSFQKTVDNQLKEKIKLYTIDPSTRYPAVPHAAKKQISHLFDSDKKKT